MAIYVQRHVDPKIVRLIISPITCFIASDSSKKKATLMTILCLKYLAISFSSMLLANFGQLPYLNYQEYFAQGSAEKLDFTEPINLSNNIKDSVYAQIASHGKNVYVVWEENDPDSQDKQGFSQYDNKRNYDILMKKSTDGGLTFGKEINLSNNRGFSEHPQIAISEDSVHVAWIDNSLSTTKDILYRKSSDGGATFSDIVNLSNSRNKGDSDNLEIAAAGNNVYAVWQETGSEIINYNELRNITSDNNNANSLITVGKRNSSILVKASTDGGNTFANPIMLSNNTFKSYPKIAANENSSYVVWNVGIVGDLDESEMGNGLYFRKSLDNGNTFGDTSRLDNGSDLIGEAQIAARGNKVYVVWGGNPDDKVAGDLLFTKSDDSGSSFSIPMAITEGNTLNVEVATQSDNTVYVAWQAIVSEHNEEILITKSSDGGATFSDESVNISRNPGISECTSISVSDDGTLYMAWEDGTFGNHEILFAKST